jgi:hypothetical protein
MTKDNEIPGLDNARAWYASIVEMVTELEKARDHWRGATDTDESQSVEDAEQCIHDSVLSVEVRSGWWTAGENRDSDVTKPVEYRILLSTGGPALQIVGALSEHGEPETAELQGQDWFKPWTSVPWGALLPPAPAGSDIGAFTDAEVEAMDKMRETLLTFARCFYFGE